MEIKNLIKGYFEKNLGDDLFVKILLDRYKNIQFDLYSKFNYNNVFNNANINLYNDMSKEIIYKKIINLKNRLLKNKKRISLEDVRKYDNIITIGGSIFMENEVIDYDVYKCNKFNSNSNCFIIGSNFGPYKTDKYVDFHKNEIFNKVQDVCFREKYSFNLFKDLPNVRVAPDIVFGLDISNIKITDNNNVIISVVNCSKDGMNLNQELYNKKINELIEFFVNKKFEITMMSFSQKQGDEKIIEDIIKMSKYKDKIKKYFYKGNIEEALNVIGDSKIVIGTRFHANILGMVMGKTVIPIAYSNKTINVLKDMNFKGKYFDLNDFENFDVSKISEADLKYKQDINYERENAWRHFEKLDQYLKK